MYPVVVLKRGPEGAMAPPEGGNNNLGGAQKIVNSIFGKFFVSEIYASATNL